MHTSGDNRQPSFQEELCFAVGDYLATSEEDRDEALRRLAADLGGPDLDQEKAAQLILAGARHEQERHDPHVEVAETSNPDGPVVTPFSDVEPEEVEWLCSPYIPRGAITLAAGDPGCGKTMLAIEIAARLSHREPLLPGTEAPKQPGKTLYLSNEDSIANTLRPRLDAAGGDPFCVEHLATLRRGGRERPIRLADLPTIESAIGDSEPDLVVIDPVQAFLGADVDMHRANEVRPLIEGLRGLAEKYDLAVMLVCHLRKSEAERAIYRALGSVDFVAVARSVLVVAEDPKNGEVRVVAQAKSSLGAKGASLEFTIASEPDAHIEWRGQVEICADELLSRKPRSASKFNEAEKYLAEELAAGPRSATSLFENAPCSERTLKEAKKAMKIKSDKKGFQGQFMWRLPRECDRSGSTETTPKGANQTANMRPAGKAPKGNECIEADSLPSFHKKKLENLASDSALSKGAKGSQILPSLGDRADSQLAKGERVQPPREGSHLKPDEERL